MDKIRELAQALTDSASAKEKNKTSAYDTSAEVISIEGETAWIRVPGGVERTPAKMVVNAKQGDEVYVRIVGGKAYITGNVTSPPTDDSAAVRAETQAIRAMRAADAASEQAETAHKAADSAVKDARTANESANAAVEDAAMARTMAEQAEADAETAADAATAAQASAGQAATSASNAASSASQAASSASTAATAATQAVADASTAASSASAAQTSAVAAQSSANAAGESASRAQAAAAAAQADADTVLEQQEYFWHDSLGAHVLSDTDDVTGVRYRTDIKGAGMDIKVLNTNGTEDSVATFGETARVGEEDKSHVEINANGSVFYNNSEETAVIRSSKTYTEPVYIFDTIGVGNTTTQAVTDVTKTETADFHSTDYFDIDSLQENDEIIVHCTWNIQKKSSDYDTGAIDLNVVYGTSCVNTIRAINETNIECTVTLRYDGAKSLTLTLQIARQQPTAFFCSAEVSFAKYIRSYDGAAYVFGLRAANSLDTGAYAFEHGKDNEARGELSFASGESNVIRNYAKHSVAHGSENTVYTENSGAFGLGNEVGSEPSEEPYKSLGNSMFAFGYHLHATSGLRGSVWIGHWNDLPENMVAFGIGNGTSDSARSNALEVTWDGDIKFQLNTTDALYTALSNMGWL